METMYPVQLGIWTNWSHGRIMGSTLTLNRATANILIAFIAFFVTTIAAHLWAIICYFSHYYYSSSRPQNGLYHQLQAILRNNHGAVSTVFTLLEVTQTWRRTISPYSRLLPLLTLAVMFAIGTALCSLFSSKIAIGNYSGSEVLLSGARCRLLDPDRLSVEILSTFLTSISTVSSAASYVDDCYLDTLFTPPKCNTFIRSRIKPSVNQIATCPFGDLCQSNNSIIRLDSGFLNSHDDLGMNWPEEGRFLYRRVAECAPLRIDGFTSTFKISNGLSFTRYHYGPIKGDNISYTYSYPNKNIYRNLGEGSWTADPDYTLSIHKAGRRGNREINSFIPIPQLKPDVGQVQLFFLSANGIIFLNKTSDPWYRTAALPKNLTSDHEYSLQQVAASPLACTMQEQFCNPNLPGQDNCLTTGVDRETINTRAKVIFPNKFTQLHLNSVYTSLGMQGNDPYDIVTSLKERALSSRKSLFSGMQAPIAENQWQLDMQRIFEIGLANMQQGVVNFAVGEPKEFTEVSGVPVNETSIEICNNQKIRSTEYVSFSVFGLAFVLVFGVITILTSVFLHPLVCFFQNTRRFNPYPRLEWSTNGMLQLQRLAHEEIDSGQWGDTDKTVPFTKHADYLAPLDISEEKHPRLRYPKMKIHQEDSEQVLQPSSPSVTRVFRDPNSEYTAITMADEDDNLNGRVEYNDTVATNVSRYDIV